MQGKPKLIAFAGIGLGLFAIAARANIFVEDRREQRNPTFPIYRSVGLLHNPQSGASGTAFLVGKCHVVTAYHVAFMKERDPVTGRVTTTPGKAGYTAEFLIGLDPEVPGRFASRTRATVVDFGNYVDAGFQGMPGDWAILRLDDCVGKQYGFLKYARPGNDKPMPRGELMTVAFAVSRVAQAGITVEKGCKARDYGPAPGLVGVDCAFESGMSGGPVLERQSDRRWLVVGLIQQSTGRADAVLPSYSMQHRNQMVYVTAFWKALDRAIAAERPRGPTNRANKNSAAQVPR
jgi:hypothetical protein